MKNNINSSSQQVRPVVNPFTALRSLANLGSAKVAAAAMATLTATGCMEDGMVFGDRASHATQQTDAGVTLAGDAPTSVDTYAAADASYTADATTTSDVAPIDFGTVDAGAYADTQVTQDAQSTSDVPKIDATTIAGYDGGSDTGVTAQDAQDTYVAPTPPPGKFWNNHPKAPLDETMIGCTGGELPTIQHVVDNGAYTIVSLDPGKTIVSDMAEQTLVSQNGDTAYAIPYSTYPQNLDGQNYRMVGIQMQELNKKIGTYVISEKAGGVKDRMPMLPVKLLAGQDVQSAIYEVRQALANDTFAHLSDIGDALKAKLSAVGYEVQDVTPGNTATADGQTFTGNQNGVIEIYTMPDAKCTAVIQGGQNP